MLQVQVRKYNGLPLVSHLRRVQTPGSRTTADGMCASLLVWMQRATLLFTNSTATSGCSTSILISPVRRRSAAGQFPWIRRRLKFASVLHYWDCAFWMVDMVYKIYTIDHSIVNYTNVHESIRTRVLLSCNSGIRASFKLETQQKIYYTAAHALRGNRTPGGSSFSSSNGNDPGYHYPINALLLMSIYKLW